MIRDLPSPADRPDLYDGFDGGDRPAGWINPVKCPARLQALIGAPMNPIPLKSETFSPVQHRPDAHGLRYEFRHLVNAGVVSTKEYDAFVAFVDASGGITAAMARLREGESLS